MGTNECSTPITRTLCGLTKFCNPTGLCGVEVPDDIERHSEAEEGENRTTRPPVAGDDQRQPVCCVWSGTLPKCLAEHSTQRGGC